MMNVFKIEKILPQPGKVRTRGSRCRPRHARRHMIRWRVYTTSSCNTLERHSFHHRHNGPVCARWTSFSQSIGSFCSSLIARADWVPTSLPTVNSKRPTESHHPPQSRQSLPSRLRTRGLLETSGGSLSCTTIPSHWDASLPRNVGKPAQPDPAMKD